MSSNLELETHVLWGREFLDAMGDAAVILDAGGRIQAANRAALELYLPGGRSVDELEGILLAELFGKDVAHLRSERLQDVLARRTPQSFVDEDGPRAFRHTLHPLSAAAGEKGGALLLSRDVTELHLQDIELRREQQRHIFYLESLPGYVMLMRPDRSIVYVNRYFRQLFGRPDARTCSDLLGACQGLCDLCPPEEMLQDGQPRSWEWQHPEGRTFQAHARLMTDVDLSTVMVVLGIDITAHKNAEKTLRQVEQYQKAILDNTPDLVWLKDSNNRFVAANRAYAAACGNDEQTIAGQGHEEVWQGEVGRRLQQHDAAVLEGGERVIDEDEIEDAAGEPRWLETVRVPIFDAERRLLGLVGVARDITERKMAVDMLLYSHAEMERHVQERTTRLRETVQQLKREVEERKRTEQALERARHRAEAATRAKSLFLANMSHEIRTPLNVIIAMADMALRNKGGLERRRALEMVREAGGSLLHVINDILDFSKIEARKLELEDVAFDLPKLLQGVFGIHVLPARNKGLEARLEIAEQTPQAVRGDPERLRQILGNLLANAVKFTRYGSVVLQARPLEPPQGAQVRMRFEVHDTGMGLPLDKQQLIFESFQQADSATTREHGGSGLGLSIVKRLVELMHGEVGLESEPGKGSVFFVTLPLALASSAELRPAETAPEDAAAPELPPLRILLAEDNALNSELLRSFLGEQGHTVLEATDGLQALEMLKNMTVDLVLMDIQMPMLDGVAATQTLRQARSMATASDVPVLALTAHAMRGDKERFLKAGFDGYVPKPLDLDVLVAEMARVLAGRGQEPAASGNELSCEKAGSDNAWQWLAQELLQEAPKGLDNREQALALLQGNEALLRRLDGHFLRDAPPELTSLREAVEAGAISRVKQVAHSLKGQAATIGAGRAAALARNMEGAAAALETERLQELLTALQEEVLAVTAELERMPPV